MRPRPTQPTFTPLSTTATTTAPPHPPSKPLQYNATVEGTTKAGRLIPGANWLQFRTVPALSVASTLAKNPTRGSATATQTPAGAFAKFRWSLRNVTGCACPSLCCITTETARPSASFSGLRPNTTVSTAPANFPGTKQTALGSQRFARSFSGGGPRAFMAPRLDQPQPTDADCTARAPSCAVHCHCRRSGSRWQGLAGLRRHAPQNGGGIVRSYPSGVPSSAPALPATAGALAATAIATAAAVSPYAPGEGSPAIAATPAAITTAALSLPATSPSALATPAIPLASPAVSVPSPSQPLSPFAGSPAP